MDKRECKNIISRCKSIQFIYVKCVQSTKAALTALPEATGVNGGGGDSGSSTNKHISEVWKIVGNP